MKNLLLSVLTLFMAVTVVNVMAQQKVLKMPLVEEFTNASCAPCAAQNPSFDALIDPLDDKVNLIKYQTVFPGFDPMNQQNPTQVATRLAYYPGVTGVPTAIVDGVIPDVSPSYPGAPGAFTQTLMDGFIDDSTTLMMELSHSFNVDYTEADFTLTLTNVGDAVWSTPNAVIHLGLIEKVIDFPSAPGSNGEEEFFSVMRALIFGNAGRAMSDINPGESLVITETVALPGYLYNLAEIGLVSWVQDVPTKEVFQSVESFPLPVTGLPDLAVNDLMGAPLSFCATEVNPSVNISNDGDVEITSFLGEYTDSEGNTVVIDWTGSLMQGESVDYDLGMLSVSAGDYSGSVEIDDINNGAIDYNRLNQTSQDLEFIVFEEDATYDGMLEQGMESPDLSDLTLTDAIIDKPNIQALRTVEASNFGGAYPESNAGAYGESRFAIFAFFNNWDFNTSTTATLTTEKADFTLRTDLELSFDFQGIPATNAGGGLDDNEMTVMASSDCGETWDDLATYSLITDLATRAPATAAAPLAEWWPLNDAWGSDTLDFSAYDGFDEVLVRFEFERQGGGFLYIDNIQTNGTVVAVNDPAKEVNEFAVYPNPTSDIALIDYTLTEATAVTIDVVDLMGRNVAQIMNNNTMNIGNHQVRFDATDLQNGVYMVNIRTASGLTTKRVVVSH